MGKPYLSIIATTRNDNHGGDLLKRTSCFVEGVYTQASKFTLAIELIIVEWNPPKDKPLLEELLPKPPKNNPVTLRFIIVPESIHSSFTMSERMPLFQMTAKNVGIRRAKGDFVLCTNIDLLFSDQLFAFLAKKNLEKGSFYRANRVDVPAEVMDIEGLNQKLSFGKNNVIAVHGKKKGNEYLIGLPKFMYAFTNLVKILNWASRKLLTLFYSRENCLMYFLDTSACGDFTLMHKDDWILMEGYPELDLYSIHIDSMGLIGATAKGLKQEILPSSMCSYHIYHEN